MKTYGQSWIVHPLVAFLLIFVSSIVYQAYNNPQVSFGTRLTFTIVVIIYDLGVLYLYLATCLNRYEATDDGLYVHRLFLFRSGFYPWNQITRIIWARPIKTILVYGPQRMIFFSSTDCFPNIAEFLHLLHQRSGCSLSPRLQKAMYPEQSSQS